MSDLSWQELVRLVHERARYCCEYCHTCQSIIGQAMHVDHIDPIGEDSLDNLCLSCPNCNLSKSQAIEAVDPLSRETCRLFNPRQDGWLEHFRWAKAGIEIEGITAIGRATVARLKVNQDRILVSRAYWVHSGLHPPSFL